MGGIPPAEPSQFRSDIFKQTPPSPAIEGFDGQARKNYKFPLRIAERYALLKKKAARELCRAAVEWCLPFRQTKRGACDALAKTLLNSQQVIPKKTVFGFFKNLQRLREKPPFMLYRICRSSEKHTASPKKEKGDKIKLMTITKFGHCCLLVKENGLRILTDPGTYSTSQNEARDVNVVLITHEHPDHYHIDSVKSVMKNNPAAKIITNSAVRALLEKEGITSVVLEDGQETIEKGISIEGIGNIHAVIYPTLPRVQNTGYFIANRFFYPGDALTNPQRPVEILAVPIAGPWMRMSEGIDYAKELKPKICFPVHDGGLKNPGLVHRIPKMILDPLGIEFAVIKPDTSREF